MVRLEVQKIDSSRLRINLYQASETPSVIKTYQTVDLPGIETLIKEVVIQIPRRFLRHGADVELLEQLTSKAGILFHTVFGDMGKVMKQLCQPASPTDLSILIDDELNFLPFEILHTGTYFLWEGFKITRQISASPDHTPRSPVKIRRLKKMTLAGNPSGDAQLETSIRNELYAIAGIWEHELEISGPHFGRTNTRYRLSGLLSGSDLFHFSGHYVTHSEVGVPVDGWLLPDGTVFSAADISNLQKPPQFLFSNSCGDVSSLGPGGFIRSLLHSGVRCMISTIGTVPTRQASHFSMLVYAALQEGKTAADAVSTARKSLVSRFGMSDLSWMFYSLYGDGGFTIRLSKSVTFRKYKSRLKLAIIGVGVVAGLFLIKSGIELIEGRTVRVTSTPASIRINVNGELRGMTPSVCSVSSLDEIELITDGYDTARYHLKKVKKEWVGASVNVPYYILSNGKISPTHVAEKGHLHVNLIPESFHTLVFDKMGRSRLMIQGIPGEITANTIKIAVDDRPYRFLISHRNDIYDNMLEVKEDVVINMETVFDLWQKNRYR